MATLILRLALLLPIHLFFIVRVDQRLRPKIVHQACLPDKVYAVTIFELVKYTITADNNEIVIVAVDAESCDIGISYYNSVVTLKPLELCLNISECSAD